jgi:hypothetical protein|tara:strand:+ start:519 stop:707 length:189 start_codon:yes stop_codon:yes gene_type:complete
MLEGVSRTLMVAGILRKVILQFSPLYAREIFLSKNGRWHFEKSHFTVPSAPRPEVFSSENGR